MIVFLIIIILFIYLIIGRVISERRWYTEGYYDDIDAIGIMSFWPFYLIWKTICYIGDTIARLTL